MISLGNCDPWSAIYFLTKYAEHLLFIILYYFSIWVLIDLHLIYMCTRFLMILHIMCAKSVKYRNHNRSVFCYINALTVRMICVPQLDVKHPCLCFPHLSSNLLLFSFAGWLFGSFYGYCPRGAYKETRRDISWKTSGSSYALLSVCFLSWWKLISGSSCNDNWWANSPLFLCCYLCIRQSLVDIALRSTAAASDPSHEDLTCCVVSL